KALAALGVELSKVRTALEFIIGRGDQPTSPSDITLSPRTKKVIELSIDEARRMGDQHIGPEHILLGLVREGDGIASGILESLGRGLAHRGRQAQSTRREAAGPRRTQPWTGHEEDPRAGDRGGPREGLARARAHPPRDRPPACDDRREGPRLAWRNSRARARGDRKAWRIGRLTAHTRLVGSNRGPFPDS